MFKGKLKKFTSTVKTAYVSVLLSQSYGYLIHIILGVYNVQGRSSTFVIHFFVLDLNHSDQENIFYPQKVIYSWQQECFSYLKKHYMENYVNKEVKYLEGDEVKEKHKKDQVKTNMSISISIGSHMYNVIYLNSILLLLIN